MSAQATTGPSTTTRVLLLFGLSGERRDDQGMSAADPKRIQISNYDPTWPSQFRRIAETLRRDLGDEVLRIDHIGSTAVPGLPAKDLIDVQLTVGRIVDADRWPDELLPGVTRRPEITGDHLPTGASEDPNEWKKRYWSDRNGIHVHVREQGRPNQRYALLFATTCAPTLQRPGRTATSSAPSLMQLRRIGIPTTR